MAGAWLAAVPPFEGPDELQHYDYARYVAYYGHLPDRIPSTLNEGGWFTVQRVQEGAYYWTLGHLLRLTGAADASPAVFTQNPHSRWVGGLEATLLRHDTPMAPALARGIFVGRLVALLCGLGTLLCVFGAVCVYAKSPRVAALVATCVALIPEFGVHHVLVTNDPPAAFLASVAVFLLIRWFLRSPADAWPLPLAAGVITGLAIATKLTTGFLLVLAPLLFWTKARLADHHGVARERGQEGRDDKEPVVVKKTDSLPSRPRVRALLWIAVMWAAAVFAAAAWNFVRNWILFGDPLATRLKNTLVAQHGNPVHFHPGELASWRELASVMFHGFWVSVGWTDWRPDSLAIWAFYGLLSLLLLIALGIARGTQPQRRALVRVLLVVLVLHTIAFFVALAHTPGYSMRYFLPLTVPLAVLVTTGMRRLRALAAGRVGAGVVRWAIAGVLMLLVIAWIATYTGALLAFRAGAV